MIVYVKDSTDRRSCSCGSVAISENCGMKTYPIRIDYPFSITAEVLDE
jgi:hypothetical protein